MVAMSKPARADYGACGAMAVWMICSSKFGKVREREAYLDLLEWRGDERVLDAGAGCS